MGYLKPVQEYKADYYVKNIEKYRERNRLYREKQKAIREGTYVEPVAPVAPVVEAKKPKQIIVFF